MPFCCSIDSGSARCGAAARFLAARFLLGITIRLSQSDANAAAVLLDELDAGRFQCGPKRIDSALTEGLAAFETGDCVSRDLRGISEFPHAHLERCSRHSALYRSHSITL